MTRRPAPQQIAQLESLAHDAESLRYVLDYLQLDGLLRWENGDGKKAANDECGRFNDELPDHGGPPVEWAPSVSADRSSFIIHTSSPLSSFVGNVLFSYMVAALVLGTALAIASVWKLSTYPELARKGDEAHLCEAPSGPFRQMGPVPFRASRKGSSSAGSRAWSIAAGWKIRKSEIPRPNPKTQSLVSLGDKFALRSGLMEITYDTGAKVILQGPVTYEVESAAAAISRSAS